MRQSLLLPFISGVCFSSVTGLAIAQSSVPVSTEKPASQANSALKMPVRKAESGIDLQWLDKSVRPQDDFFRFMSGKWLDTVEIPADRGRYGAFDQLRELSSKQSADIITELAARKDLKNATNQQKLPICIQALWMKHVWKSSISSHYRQILHGFSNLKKRPICLQCWLT